MAAGAAGSLFCAAAETPFPVEAAALPAAERGRVTQSAAKESAEGRPLRSRAQEAPRWLLEAQNAKNNEEKLPSLEGLDRERTRYWIKRYSSKGHLDWIASTLKTGEPYLDFIRSEIARRGMPPELLYLPVIESGFLATAKSNSGARGMWQFMRNSMHPYMKLNEWVDERLDFWKSTEGALSKLEAHYKEFGSWPLALAAYNSGAGAVGRLVKNGGRDYWLLAEQKKLKTESIHYVPKLLAVSYIISNPRKFNLDICRPSLEYDWTRIELTKQVNLASVAEHSGVDVNTLRAANRELHTLVTPPGAYLLKVPAKDAETVRGVLERDDLKLLQHYLYTIKGGDTLFALALHYGVSVEQIRKQNPNLRPEALKPGERVLIPAFKETAPYKGASAAAAKSASTPKSAPAPAPVPAAAQSAAWTGSRAVRKGDTLWSLAREYRVSADELAAANKLALSSILSIGAVLRVPR
jgi:membrane-bound lytic murein transglycosylase D